MNEIQILAVFLFGMSIPSVLAFMYWRERNYYIDELYEADQQHYALLKDMKFWKNLAMQNKQNEEVSA